MFAHSDEGPLEVQQLFFGLREVSVVTTQLKHPQHQHQRTVLKHKHICYYVSVICSSYLYWCLPFETVVAVQFGDISCRDVCFHKYQMIHLKTPLSRCSRLTEFWDLFYFTWALIFSSTYKLAQLYVLLANIALLLHCIYLIFRCYIRNKEVHFKIRILPVSVIINDMWLC